MHGPGCPRRCDTQLTRPLIYSRISSHALLHCIALPFLSMDQEGARHTSFLSGTCELTHKEQAHVKYSNEGKRRRCDGSCHMPLCQQNAVVELSLTDLTLTIHHHINIRLTILASPSIVHTAHISSSPPATRYSYIDSSPSTPLTQTHPSTKHVCICTSRVRTNQARTRRVRTPRVCTRHACTNRGYTNRICTNHVRKMAERPLQQRLRR